jgi:hypothetical protein
MVTRASSERYPRHNVACVLYTGLAPCRLAGIVPGRNANAVQQAELVCISESAQ